MNTYKIEILDKNLDTIVQAAAVVEEDMLATETALWCRAGYRVRVSVVEQETEGGNWNV